MRAESRLHTQVLVFIPAYEGSQLYDSTLLPKGEDPPCVWGGIDAIRSATLYFSLRMPNPLDARPMLTAGPIDVYGKFLSAMTEDQDDAPHFVPYTAGADFLHLFLRLAAGDCDGDCPATDRCANQYALLHEQKDRHPGGADTTFVIVGHSMGTSPRGRCWASIPRNGLPGAFSALYLFVGCLNLGAGQGRSRPWSKRGRAASRKTRWAFPRRCSLSLPNNVDVNITKLTAISRPSLYELLPFDDPRWECVEADGSRRRVAAEDMLTVGPWEPYWPSAELERRLFLDDWLKKREAEGRKQIVPADWEFCQDPQFGALQKILAQVRDWRLRMGSLSYTSTLLTLPGEPTRLRVILGTGLKTPTGIITEGAHDSSLARYTYAPDNDGDETVTGASALDDLRGTPEHR